MTDIVPVRFAFSINGVLEGISEVEPPDDAYDEGTLLRLFSESQVDALELRLEAWKALAKEWKDQCLCLHAELEGRRNP